jgi:Na+-driven multidrug efflux pump
MSGWTAYLKVDHLLFLPVQSIGLAVTTFVGQNLGSKQVNRAKKGVTCALLISMAATVLLMIPLLIFAPQIVGFLNSKPEVVENGAMFLRWLSPFYVLCCFNQIYASALRGAGNSRASMIIMLLSFVGFRQLYLFAMSQICYEIIPIALGYPAGWLVCSLITAIYYHRTGLSKNRLAE